MVEALLVIAGAATVLIAKWLARWWTEEEPAPAKQHEMLIDVSPRTQSTFVRVSMYAPEGWNPNIHVSRHHFPRDRNMTTE